VGTRGKSLISPISHILPFTKFSPLPKPFSPKAFDCLVFGLHQLVGGPNALCDWQGALRRKKAVLQIERMRLESKRTGDASKKPH
jgi:hypothetical protein